MMDHKPCVFARNVEFRPSQNTCPLERPARITDKAGLGTRKPTRLESCLPHHPGTGWPNPFSKGWVRSQSWNLPGHNSHTSPLTPTTLSPESYRWPSEANPENEKPHSSLHLSLATALPFLKPLTRPPPWSCPLEQLSGLSGEQRTERWGRRVGCGVWSEL